MTSNDSITSQDNPQDVSQTISLPLTKGYVAITDLIDADLAAFKWYAMVNVRAAYAARHVYHNPRYVTYFLHRIILERIIGRELTKGEYVDHINGDGLDNRRCNLRLATRSQNAQNRRLKIDSASGYKGVTFHRQNQKWVAQIVLNRKHIYLGSFDTPEAAHEAYCEAAREHFGEFARFE